MPKLRVHAMTMSLDGYVAGPGQNLENPLGVGGVRLHDWIFASAAGRRLIGLASGEEGIDSEFIESGFDGIGATIMGPNMFSRSGAPGTASASSGSAGGAGTRRSTTRCTS